MQPRSGVVGISTEGFLRSTTQTIVVFHNFSEAVKSKQTNHLFFQCLLIPARNTAYFLIHILVCIFNCCIYYWMSERCPSLSPESWRWFCCWIFTWQKEKWLFFSINCLKAFKKKLDFLHFIWTHTNVLTSSHTPTECMILWPFLRDYKW